METKHSRALGRSARLALTLALLTTTLAQVSCQRDEIPPDAFVVLLDAHPKGLDPRFPVGDASAKIIGLLHAGLVSVDTRDGTPELELAKEIEQVNPTTYKITLRDDIFFHDGQPVTAEDVEYTFMELDKEPVSSPLAGMSRRIEKFTIHSPTSFTIELDEPRAPFMVELAMGIVPKHFCQGQKQCPEPHIGAGPFRYVTSNGNHMVLLEAFDKYHLGKPHIEKLAFKVVKDDNTRLLALLGGSAEVVQNAVSPLMLPVVRDDKKLEVMTTTSFKYTYLAFNMRNPILEDVRVRQAIAHGIDRESIIQHKYRGLADLSTGLLSPGHWAYEADVRSYDYNIEEAMRLLDEAGYPDPDGPEGPKPRFELELKVSSNKFRRALAALMSHQLARIGIAVTVRSYEWGTYFDDIKSGNFEMTTLQWPSVLEPSLYRWIFHSENIPTPEARSAGANRGAYRNEEIDRLLDEGMIETDQKKRAEIYSRVQKILADELPYVSLWHEHNIAVLKKGISGYHTTPNARFEALKKTKPAPASTTSP